jgi:hypothetical protein
VSRKRDDWWSNSRSGKLVCIAIIIAAILFFAGATFAVLRTLTRLPVWAEILISIPAGMSLFWWFVKTHETNGFDGPLVPLDHKSDDP